MNNKVSYAMYHEFRNRGFSVLRFNFRGVGRSEGIYEGGEGELADAAAVLDWIQSQNIHSRYTFIAGFSFGSWGRNAINDEKTRNYRFYCGITSC